MNKMVEVKGKNSYDGETDDLLDNYSQNISNSNCNGRQKKSTKETLHQISTTVCKIAGAAILTGRVIKIVSDILQIRFTKANSVFK